MKEILVTCPPMLTLKHQFIPQMKQHNMVPICPDVVQTLSEKQLSHLITQCDGWIIGDDLATEKVLQCGKSSRLQAVVKWGVGVDNIDFDACKKLNIPVKSTPGVFGKEVADLALGYVIALARETIQTDREVRKNDWPKYQGISLAGKVAGIVGLGCIGSCLVPRLQACEMDIIGYDVKKEQRQEKVKIPILAWPQNLDRCDFIIFTCSLTSDNQYMFNSSIIEQCKLGVRVVNVARGKLIKELDLVAALENGQVYSAALDVFEVEPLPLNSPLRAFERCILGSHNASNTMEAVSRTNLLAIKTMAELLEEL